MLQKEREKVVTTQSDDKIIKMEYDELKKKGKRLLEAGALEECYRMFEEALRYFQKHNHVCSLIVLNNCISFY